MVPTRSSRMARVGSSLIADQHAVQEYPCLLEDPLEVLFALEAFGIELADVLGPRRARGEPPAPSHDLHTAERRTRRRARQHLFDRLAGKFRHRHILR